MNEREIFLEALEMPSPEARAAYLQGACGRDVALRREVDALLKEHFANDSLLAGPAVEACAPTVATPLPAEGPTLELPEPVADESVGATLGRYKLREKIGEGGCGTV